jgi:response regulator of citrate/malate metabolism
MTAESDENEIHRFIQEGLTDYIEKPMEMESLELILNKYLG